MKSLRRTSRRRRLLRNVRAARLQRTLAATTAASVVPLGFEIYLEHYKGSFGDKWEWAPIVSASAARARHKVSSRADRGERTRHRSISPISRRRGSSA